MKRYRLVLLSAWLPLTAWSGNGLNLIGFGTESVLMGGADVAVARDTTALNTNPAGLTSLGKRAADVFGGIAYGSDVRHLDSFGNDRNVSNRVIPIGGFGYAARLGTSGVTAGIGLFAQGGAGNVYENLTTAFGTVDTLSGLFRIVRLSPGIGWQASDRLSIGASVPITYADATQKVFPGTSFLNPGKPAESFFGFELKGARTIRPGLKLGLQYRMSDAATLGATYTHKTKLPLDGGRLVSNMSALGLGLVTYRSARIDGLALPREVAFGVAWEPRAGVLVSVKYAWLNWADSIRTSTLSASNPDHPLAPQALSAPSVNNWSNQRIFALGVAIDLSSLTTLRAGYNYGRNPIPLNNLNPLLAAIGEQHYTVGLVHRLSPEWAFAYGLEYQRGANATYTNPALPFGANAQERSNFPAFHVMLSHRW
jgi:long-chain fatty acid transport protein